MRGITNVFSLDFLSADLFQKVIYLILAPDFTVRKDHLVQCPVVNDDPRNVAPDVPQVRQRTSGITIPNDLVVGHRHRVINLSRWQSGVRELVPPANVDDCEWQPQLLDGVVHNLFLDSETRR